MLGSIKTGPATVKNIKPRAIVTLFLLYVRWQITDKGTRKMRDHLLVTTKHRKSTIRNTHQTHTNIYSIPDSKWVNAVSARREPAYSGGSGGGGGDD